MTDTIRFLTRPNCGLCEKARTALAVVAERVGLEIEDVDISTQPELEKKYGWDIPIAFLGRTELFRHYVSARAVEEKLQATLNEENDGE